MSKANFYKSVGEAVSSARISRGMRIVDLAKLSGEQNKTIRHIEAGNACSLHHAVWIKDILGININTVTIIGEQSNDITTLNDLI